MQRVVDERLSKYIQISVVSLVISVTVLILFCVFIPKALAQEKNEEDFTPTTSHYATGADRFWSKVEALPYHFVVDVNYWRPQMNQTEYAYGNTNGGTAAPIKGGAYNIPVEWKWGFSLGAGYEFFHDDWVLNAGYTYFSGSQGASVVSTSGTLLATRAFALNGQSVNFATSNLSITWNNLDALLDKKFHFRENTIIFTKVGLETAWLKLDDITKYSGGSLGSDSVNSRSESRLWGIGPKVGARANFLFADTFYLLGSLDTALKYMINKAFYIENGPLAANAIDYKNRSEFLSPTIDLELGLGFAKYFSRNKRFVQLEASYQGHYLFRQNQLLTADPFTTPRFQTSNGDLSFQGLTLSLSFRY